MRDAGVNFKDYFSKQASNYAKYRPRYSDELFRYLVNLLSERETAWDCATGNGQVAFGLAPYFQKIYATDASERQISHAFSHEKISYFVAAAEQTDLSDHSVDLITVGMAVHWFDLERFYREVRRILKPNGVIAIWCYGVFEIPSASEKLSQVCLEFWKMIDPFRPPEVKMVEEQYQTIWFPFTEMLSPSFLMMAEWDAPTLVAYLYTLSATQQLIEQQGSTSMTSFAQRLVEAWSPEQPKLIQWPLYLRVGKL